MLAMRTQHALTLLATLGSSALIPSVARAQPDADFTGGRVLVTTSLIGGWQRLTDAMSFFNPGTPVSTPWSWTMSYGDRSATLVGQGQLAGTPFTVTGIGTLTGSVGGDLFWRDDWTGSLGADPVRATTSLRFLWDNATSSYLEGTFAQSGQIGTNTSQWDDQGAHLLFKFFNRLKVPGWEFDPDLNWKVNDITQASQEDREWFVREATKDGVRLVRPRDPACLSRSTGVKGSIGISASDCTSSTDGTLRNGNGGGRSVVTPEPGAAALLLVPLLGLVVAWRRRRATV